FVSLSLGRSPVERSGCRRRRRRRRGHSCRISHSGVLGDHGLHRHPGRGLRLRVAQRSFRMAVSTSQGAVAPASCRAEIAGLKVEAAGRPELPKNTFVTQVDAVVNWCRKYSLWPMPFATACCGIELMAAGASRFDIARFGAEVMRFSPRQCDLLIVAGRVAMKMMPVLQRIWLQMPEPKWCISMGACASS